VPWWVLGSLVWIGYGGLLLAVLWVVADRWGGALDRLADRSWSIVMGVPTRAFVAAASLATVLLGVGIALYCYAGRGFTGDEMAMAWHARMLVSGHLAIPMPPHGEFFNTVSVLERGGRWFSQYPIGGPALLAVGLLVGAVWLVNPLLLGAATWQLHRFVRRTFGESTARAATLLFVLSPFVLVPILLYFMAFPAEHHWLGIDLQHAIFVIIGLLPGVAAAMTGYGERIAFKAHARQYDRMRMLFERAYDLLPEEIGSDTTALAHALYHELGIESMRENAEWVAIYRQRPIQPQ